MDVAAAARIAAWKVIANTGLPAGTKVIVEDGQVTIRPHGGQPASVPFGPADTPESLYSAIKDASRPTPQDFH